MAAHGLQEGDRQRAAAHALAAAVHSARAAGSGRVRAVPPALRGGEHASPLTYGGSRMIGRHRWSVLGVAAAAVGVGRFAVARPAPGPEVVVYKSPSCGCCKKWVEHVQATGFRVTVHDTTNLTAVGEHYGVAPN